VEFITSHFGWRPPNEETVGMAISRGEGYGIGYPVDGGIVAAEPWFSNHQVPSGKFCDLEGELFHMLVNGKFQVTCML